MLTRIMDEKTVPWEDHLLERKTERDLKDIRRTAVAFANSVRPGHIATILIGECDDGSVPGITNVDKLQRDIRQELEKIYPEIIWRQRPYEKNGRTCLQVEIEFSGDTPHFGDAAWIRKGNESVKASHDMFDKLVAIRNGIARELMKWIGKPVTLSWAIGTHASAGTNWSSGDFIVEDVTEFFATFRATNSAARRSEPFRGWN
jgi:schlafen family protein